MKRKILYGILMVFVLLAVALPTMVWLECPGYIYIEGTWFGMLMEVKEWKVNRRNSIQQTHYMDAFLEKMKTRQPMISLYDENYYPTGKTKSVRQKRWVSLFSDGSFLALNHNTVTGFLQSGKYISCVSGQWERGENTMVVLKCEDVSLVYAPVDLSSATNFPPQRE